MMMISMVVVFYLDVGRLVFWYNMYSSRLGTLPILYLYPFSTCLLGIYFHIWNTGNLFNAKWNSLHALQPDEGDTLVPRSTFTSHHTSSATQPPVQVTSPTISVPPEESLFVQAGRRLVANFLVSSCDCCCQSITLGLIKYIAFCLDILGTCYGGCMAVVDEWKTLQGVEEEWMVEEEHT